MARVDKIPVKYCSDCEVQHYIDHEAWDFRPYCPEPPVKTARELFAAARARFTDYRCLDLIIQVH